MTLLLLALSPAIFLLIYVYFRDKYEREPIVLLLKGVLFGALIIFPVGLIENFLETFNPQFPALTKAAYTGFFTAGFTEELFKLLAVLALFWHNRNFNEKFDGIVYAVSVSLGFAAIENIFYVFNEGSTQIGIIRAFTAVPAHAIFGVIMGFYLGLAKFNPENSRKWLFRALFVPWLFHGVYDFLLLSGNYLSLFIFLPFLIYMYRVGLRRMKELNAESQFNPANIHFEVDKPSDLSENEQEKKHE